MRVKLNPSMTTPPQPPPPPPAPQSPEELARKAWEKRKQAESLQRIVGLCAIGWSLLECGWLAYTGSSVGSLPAVGVGLSVLTLLLPGLVLYRDPQPSSSLGRVFQALNAVLLPLMMCLGGASLFIGGSNKMLAQTETFLQLMCMGMIVRVFVMNRLAAATRRPSPTAR